MRLTCTVRYDTAPGESLEVDFDGSISPMSWIGDGWWWTEVVAYRGAPYRYRVTRAGAVASVEPGWRSTPVFADDLGTVVDRWRDSDPERPALTSALFRNAVAARHGAPLHGPLSGISFAALVAAVPHGHRPGVVGSVPGLGGWDPDAVAVMQPAPFPWWRVSIAEAAEAVAGARYKLVLVDEAGTVVRWEPGADRRPPGEPEGIRAGAGEGRPRLRARGVARRRSGAARVLAAHRPVGRRGAVHRSDPSRRLGG